MYSKKFTVCGTPGSPEKKNHSSIAPEMIRSVSAIEINPHAWADSDPAADKTADSTADAGESAKEKERGFRAADGTEQKRPEKANGKSVGKKRKSGKSRRAGTSRTLLAFFAVCILAAAGTAAMPIPLTLEKPLAALAAFIAVPAADAHDSSADALRQGASVRKDASENADAADASDGASSGAPGDGSLSSSGSEPETDSQTISLAAQELSKLSNETAYTVKLDELFAEAYPIEPLTPESKSEKEENKEVVDVFSPSSAAFAPQVLIVHTHGTEGYADSAENAYRSQNIEQNVVAVGAAFADALGECGLSALHCETMFDADSYIKAYTNSYAAVQNYLLQYPSIRYIIDLHRDAIPDAAGGYARLAADIEGTSYAQLMLVVGTDEAGARHPNWKNNLRTAAELQKSACASYPGLMRPINLRKASFNQQLSPGYLLLEVGSCGNRLDEACGAVRLFAKSFADAVCAEK